MAGLESGMVSLNLNSTAAPPAMNPFSPSFPAPAAPPATTGTYQVGAPLAAHASNPPAVPSFSPQVQGTPVIGAGMPQPLVPMSPPSNPQSSPASVGNSDVTVTATASPLLTDITAGASPAPLIPLPSNSMASGDIAATFTPSPALPPQPIVTS